MFNSYFITSILASLRAINILIPLSCATLQTCLTFDHSEVIVVQYHYMNFLRKEQKAKKKGFLTSIANLWQSSQQYIYTDTLQIFK